MVFLGALINLLLFYFLYQKNLKYFLFLFIYLHLLMFYTKFRLRIHRFHLITKLSFFNYLFNLICWFPLTLFNIVIYLFLQNVWKLIFVFYSIISILQLLNEQLLLPLSLLEIQLTNVLLLYFRKEHKHS